MDMSSRRRNSNSAHLTKLLFVTKALILVYACATATPGQSRSPSARDTARQIQRVERDQQLLLKPIPPKKEDDFARRAALKQSREDFRNLQEIHNKMMANAWAKDELDYNSISDSIYQIRSKAIGLRSNLSLPKS